MLETSANGALNSEISQIKALNQRILAGDSVYGQKKPIELNIIQPNIPLPLDPDLYLGNITNETLIDMGYADAKAYFKSKTPNGMLLENNMTRMKEPEPGIRFCESQNGIIHFEENSEQAVNLNLTIHISSLRKLTETPAQMERITGRISIGSLVQNKIINNGYFHINYADDNTNLKTINYEIMFSVNEIEYKFVGKKKIFDDPGFDYIEDLSSVFVELFIAEDGRTPVARGKLNLSIKALAKQAASIRATHVASPVESAKMIAKFSAFYLQNSADKEQLA